MSASPLFYISFFFLSFSPYRPEKMFYGKDCWSLAVAIGSGMHLHPILLHSTNLHRTLTKGHLVLIMQFLQAILPSSRAKKDVVAPTPLLSPVPSAILEAHNPLVSFTFGSFVFLSWHLALGF
jgi:hypothetical protein